MTAGDFVKKWRTLQDTDFSRLVGIEVKWDSIKPSSRVISYHGRDAWNKIYDFTPPWYVPSERKTFREMVDLKTSNYLNEIDMEKNKKSENKFEFIKKVGLKYPLEPVFLVFSNSSGTKGVLGDGCHRFLVASYLINVEKLNLASDINKTDLDIICLDNFEQVIPFDPF